MLYLTRKIKSLNNFCSMRTASVEEILNSTFYKETLGIEKSYDKFLSNVIFNKKDQKTK